MDQRGKYQWYIVQFLRDTIGRHKLFIFPLYTCISRADLYAHYISHSVGARVLGTASRLLVNIFFIFIIRGGKGRKMRGRSGRGDGRRDGTVCEGIVALSDDRIGKAKGSCKVFVCHSIPSHSELGQDEEGRGGALVRN